MFMRSLALLALATAAVAQPAHDDAANVRTRRLAYNLALSERRAADLMAFMMPGHVVMGSSGSLKVGAPQVRDSYVSDEFRDPAFIAYDRQPDSIQISANGRFALERGHWRGRFRDGKGAETGNTGLYQAGWLKQDGVWRLRTEHYLRITCANEANCP
jgi:ketosteroid isomerase-like protein